MRSDNGRALLSIRAAEQFTPAYPFTLEVVPNAVAEGASDPKAEILLEIALWAPAVLP